MTKRWIDSKCATLPVFIEFDNAQALIEAATKSFFSGQEESASDEMKVAASENAETLKRTFDASGWAASLEDGIVVNFAVDRARVNAAEFFGALSYYVSVAALGIGKQNTQSVPMYQHQRAICAELSIACTDLYAVFHSEILNSKGRNHG